MNTPTRNPSFLTARHFVVDAETLDLRPSSALLYTLAEVLDWTGPWGVTL